MRNVINEYLSQFDLDIRKSHDARFVDQKCTPDIVCFMADCVMNMVATKPVFVINDVWETQYFIQNTRVIFNKPWANDKKAYNEYNKVLSQPLKLLAYAHILNVEMVDSALTFSAAEDSHETGIIDIERCFTVHQPANTDSSSGEFVAGF